MVSQPLTVRIAFAICVLLMLGTTVACDPGAGVSWVNETDETVVVYLRDEFVEEFGSTVPPRSTKTEAVIKAVWKDVVVIRDEQGNVLFRQELTWDELKAQDWRIVITEDMLSPTPTEGR